MAIRTYQLMAHNPIAQGRVTETMLTNAKSPTAAKRECSAWRGNNGRWKQIQTLDGEKLNQWRKTDPNSDCNNVSFISVTEVETQIPGFIGVIPDTYRREVTEVDRLLQNA